MPFTSEQLLARLQELGIPATTQNHAAVMTVEESQRLRGTIDGAHAKNLFLKDKKKRLWLVVAEESHPIDLKSLRHTIGSANLSFGRAQLLEHVLAVQPGSVTPFAVINDAEALVTVVLDQSLADADQVSFHPLTNTQSTTVSGADLLH
ncbi:prolyl-tRNA synthetase associated domain-containing protein, partial [Pseudomonadota bacterium]